MEFNQDFFQDDQSVFGEIFAFLFVIALLLALMFSLLPHGQTFNLVDKVVYVAAVQRGQPNKAFLTLVSDGKNLFTLTGTVVSYGELRGMMQDQHKAVAIVRPGSMTGDETERLRQQVFHSTGLPLRLGILPEAWLIRVRQWGESHG